MSINILGGYYRGFSLVVSKHLTIRPTSVMLRRKLFDSHQDLSDYFFVDLCAGSGAMGLEALSRGAQTILLNEKDPKVYKNLLENTDKFITKYDVSSQIELFKKDALQCLDAFMSRYEGFSDDLKSKTIIFFDPPYENLKFYEEFCAKIKSFTIFTGEIWIEADRQKTFPLDVMENKLEYSHKSYIQGTNYICIFKR